MTTFLQTTYRDGRDASALVNYLERETGAADLLNYLDREDTTLRSAHGQPLSEAEREAFLDKSRRHEFVRDVIVSPENGADLSARELAQGTRATVNEFLEDRPTASYVYAVHEDTEHPHVHVAMTGERRDLHMDREDIDQVRDRANERLVERYQHRQRHQELDRDHDLDREQDRSRTDDRDHDRDRDVTRSDRDRDQDRESDTDRERDRDEGRGYGW